MLRRQAYIAFLILGALYFPAKVRFALMPCPCDFALDARLAVLSLENYPHILFFGAFLLITTTQFERQTPMTLVWSGLLTLAAGVAVEVAEGATGAGACRLQDLVPDVVGLGVAALAMLAWIRARSSGQEH